jgi:hypothetical protein
MSDWFDPMPRLVDCQSEGTFELKRRMGQPLLSKLATHDPFWTSTHDWCGELSINPFVKFLTEQKIICYGASLSCFQYYFQMGESTT